MDVIHIKSDSSIGICIYINMNLIFKHFEQIGETLADKVDGTPLPTITVEEPTVKMSFSVNTSPFAGREVLLSFPKLVCMIGFILLFHTLHAS